MSILIIEPDATQRKGLPLSLSGFTVVQAATPAEAQKLLQTAHFEVILTELQFKIHDGLEWLQEIGSRAQQSRIIITSTPSEQLIETYLKKHPKIQFLKKLLNIDHLIKILKSIEENSK